MKKLKDNNSGFTLVELLTAVAILAVIMAPLMRSFYVAMATNLKANQYGAVTSSVGNLIENVKNINLYDLEADLEATYGSVVTTDVLSPTDSSVIGEKYTFDYDDQKVVVQYRDPQDTDAALLRALNVTDLAGYTNMDLTLIQTAGSVMQEVELDDGTVVEQSVINDVDAYAKTKFDEFFVTEERNYTVTFEDVNNAPVVKADYGKLIERTIDINLVGALKDGEEVIQYTVEYNYQIDFIRDGYTQITKKLPAYEVFKGDVGVGTTISDPNVYAIQFVYMPLNNREEGSSPIDSEKINVSFSGSLAADKQVRLFMIKQSRGTHSVGCSDFDPNDTITNSLNCDKCAHEDYDNNHYRCSVSLTSSLDNIAIYTNINKNVYDDSSLPDSRFPFTGASGLTTTLGNLVFTSEGGRIYVVEVDIYEVDESGNEALLSNMTTVKLN